MKALSIVSILALAAAGSACSQASDQDAETSEIVAEAETASDVDMSGFNLGLPTEMETPAATPAGEFNLGLESAQTSSTDGFNLGTDLGASSGLESIPEIGTSISEEPAEEVSLEPVDEEPVIRLD